MIGFLFKAASEITFEEDAKAGLPENSAAIANAAIAALEPIVSEDFKTEAIQNALQTALIEVMELKPRVAFGPIRTAVSGRRVSPPLFESMEILGKDESLQRLKQFALTV
jgi:glutamyl-tRNA synthetase